MNSVEGNTLPQGWRQVKISDVSEFIRGITFKTNDAKNNYEDGLVGVYRTKNIQETLTLDDVYFLTKEHIRNDNKYLKKGDVLISSANSLELLGKCCKYIEMDYPASLGGFISCARVNSLMNADYFYYFFASDFNQTKMRSLANKTTGIANLPLKSVSELPIPLPPLEEQKRIVAKIDALFAEIDKAISLTEKSLRQAKNLLPSSVKKLFEDGETKGWKKLKFKDFASLRHGHQFRKYDYVENGIPVVKIGQCIPGDRLDLTKCNFIDKSRETEFSNDLICKGDLLMALTGGTLGKVTWVKDDYGVVVQNYRVGNFFTDEKLCSKRFLMYALLSPIFQTLMYSKINVAAQPNIGKEEIENLEFILPSLEEQSKVVDRLDNLTFKVKQTQSKLEQQLAYLKQLKSSILSKAFKGEL